MSKSMRITGHVSRANDSLFLKKCLIFIRASLFHALLIYLIHLMTSSDRDKSYLALVKSSDQNT